MTGEMLEIQLQSLIVPRFSLQCWQHGEDLEFMEAWTHPCAKCVSTFLTLPLWFPVVVPADKNFGSDPSDDFGEKMDNENEGN